MYRTALGAWFNAPEPDALAYQAVKYRSRDGWALADVLRLTRPTPRTAAHSAVYKWLVDGETGEEVPELIAAVTLLASMTDPSEAARLIGERRIPREAVPTELLNHREVWEALLEDMPQTALLRNLGKMTAVGLLAPMSAAAQKTAAQLIHRFKQIGATLRRGVCKGRIQDAGRVVDAATRFLQFNLPRQFRCDLLELHDHRF